jgi:transglutaminase-like putative cysteine protease
VETRQAINFHVTTSTIPLSMKALRFIARDAEYRLLAAQVTRGSASEEERLLRLVRWVRANIRPYVPEGMPLVDDHVWHTIVRGYGAADQLADVLATLCAYAGLPADLLMLTPPGAPDPAHALTLVQIGSAWHVVDPYYGVMVRRADGRLATLDELLRDRDLVRRTAPGVTAAGIEYAGMYDWLSPLSPRPEPRPYRHMPLHRTWFLITRGARSLWSSAP